MLSSHRVGLVLAFVAGGMVASMVLLKSAQPQQTVVFSGAAKSCTSCPSLQRPARKEGAKSDLVADLNVARASWSGCEAGAAVAAHARTASFHTWSLRGKEATVRLHGKGVCPHDSLSVILPGESEDGKVLGKTMR